jgi:hypothetical protein
MASDYPPARVVVTPRTVADMVHPVAPDNHEAPLSALFERAADKGYAVVISRTQADGWRISLIVPTEGVHMSDRIATGSEVETAARHMLATIETYADL